MNTLARTLFTGGTVATLLTLPAQVPPPIEWQRCLGGSMGEGAVAIDGTADGGYVVAGSTRSTDGDVGGPHHGDRDVWVVKLDATGGLEWERCYGGSDYEIGRAVRQTADGGYIVAGETGSTDGDVSGHHGASDIWVIKLGPLGDLEWQRCLGGSSSEYTESIAQVPGGGYIVAGYTESNHNSDSLCHGRIDREAWVVKLAPDGVPQWQQCFGGPGNDAAWRVALTADGGYVLAGSSNSNNTPSGGSYGDQNLWVVKVDATGALEWERYMGGLGSDVARAVQQTPDGGYIVAGWTFSSSMPGHHGGQDVWLVKLAANGEPEWERCFGGSADESAWTVQVTGEGNYLVAESTSSSDGDVDGYHGNIDGWLLEVSATGDLLWQKCIGGGNVDQLRGISPPGSGGFAVAGSTRSNDGDVSGNHGGYDVWVVKLRGLTTGAGVEEEGSGALEVFPNPASDVLYIGLGGLEGTGWQLDILDALGRSVHTRTGISTGQSRLALPTSHLAQGSYCVRLHNGMRSHTVRFIKQ